jgi:hypothetical protein
MPESNKQKEKAKMNFNIFSIKKDDLKDFLEKKEEEIKNNLSKQKTANKIRTFSILAVLLLSTVILSVFYYSQSQENSKKISLSENRLQQVAGIFEDIKKPESKAITAVTGESFSIKLEKPAPEIFEKEIKETESIFLENKQAIKTTFLANVKDQESRLLKSGISVEVVEFDNKYSNQTFANLVLEKLGQDFQVETRSIAIPKGFLLTKISNQDTEFYTGVTQDYYYLIQIFRETKNNQSFQEINDFTDSILENLYLN